MYKLYNLSPDFSDSFSSDITGSFDLSSDDYYHVDENDDLVSNLPAGWSTYTPTHKYTSHYDAENSDSVGYNSLAIVHFNNTPGISFNDLALKKSSLNSRISYNSASPLPEDETNYLFVFTMGDYRTIDEWMPAIENGSFPEPNFLIKARCDNGTTMICSNQLGVCEGSYQTCTNNIWPGCNYESIPDYETEETTCDGLDNDCDGPIDEGCSITDADNDGVIDVWDDCPDTPPQSLVDNRGCPGSCNVTTVDLIQGWNLICAPTSTIKPINETLNVSEISAVFMYNNSKWYGYDPLKPPNLNTLNYFFPGYGYWVKK